jgi:capsular exopolysaccharide synthesis family protein
MSNRRRYAVTTVSQPPATAVDPHYVDPYYVGHSYAGGMETELRSYIDIFRRRAGWIIWITLVMVSLAFAYTMLQGPTYRATALLELRGGGSGQSIEGLFSDEDPSSESLRTRFGLMRSATLAQRVIDELDLDETGEFNPEGSALPQEIVDDFLERLVIDPVEDSRLVMVHFHASSAELAALIANQVVTTYADLRVASHEDAARRVAQQADSVQTRLAAAEDTLRRFAQANDLPVLVEEDLSVQISSRLGALRDRLAEAEGQRYEDESMYDVVVRDGRHDLVEDEALQVLTLRLSELRGEHARISATFTENYPAAAELTRQIEHVRELIGEERERLAGRVESDYRLALQREATLGAAIGSQEELANELGPASGNYHVLRQAVLANRQLFATLLDRRREAEIIAAIGATDLAIIDAATPPLVPYRPIFAMNIGLALMLGLVIGVIVAFGRELFDDTVQTADDFPISDDVPILAMIPSMGAEGPDGSPLRTATDMSGLLPWPGRDNRARVHQVTWPRIDTVDRRGPTGNALADSFGALRTAVLFKDHDPLPRSILVSSCRAGEGKTTVSVNFAMSLAQLGHRVLLIDADLRKPAVHRAFKIPASPGLVNCLTNGARWRDVVRSGVSDGLDVLTSGGATTRAGDLLAGNRLAPLLARAEEHYDFVVVDAPALFINASDARLLSQMVDGVVVVVRSRSTPRALVDRIPRTVPNVMGVVVNDLKKDSLPGYFADYFADYGPSVDHFKSPGWRSNSDTPPGHSSVSAHDYDNTNQR